MSEWTELKGLLLDGAKDSLSNLWSSDEDREFLEYTAEKTAKYLFLLKTATEETKRAQARYNLRMLQTVATSYLSQKAIVAQYGAEKVARALGEAVFKILVARVTG